MDIRMGDIYYIQRRQNNDGDENKRRLAVVVSGPLMNDYGISVIVAYLVPPREKYTQTHAIIYLGSERYACACERSRVIFKDQLEEYVDHISTGERLKVERALRVALEINSPIHSCSVTPKYKRGQVYYIDISDTKLAEDLGKNERRAIIVSNDWDNHYTKRVQVVFLKGSAKRGLPYRTTVHGIEGKRKVALCEGITSVPKSQLRDYITTISDDEMKKVTDAMGVAIGFCEYNTVIREFMENQPIDNVQPTPVPVDKENSDEEYIPTTETDCSKYDDGGLHYKLCTSSANS